MGTNSNYTLRIPTSLKQSVEQITQQNGTSINQFIVTAVAEKLAAMKTADYFAERAKSGNVQAALDLLNRQGGLSPQVGDEIME